MDALEKYIESIESDIQELKDYEENISPLNCCDAREYEILDNVLHALTIVNKELKEKEINVN